MYYYFSTVTMFERTSVHVTLRVHGLSCSNRLQFLVYLCNMVCVQIKHRMLKFLENKTLD
jgi:hypothetical protein